MIKNIFSTLLDQFTQTSVSASPEGNEKGDTKEVLIHNNLIISNLSNSSKKYSSEKLRDGNTFPSVSVTVSVSSFIKDKDYFIELWDESKGCIGPLIAIDTETEEIKEEFTVPGMALLSAANTEKKAFIVAPQDTARFLDAHKESFMVLHNVPFDRNVILKTSGVDLCLWTDRNMLLDTGMYYQLMTLAETGTVPLKWSLDIVAYNLLNMTVDKSTDIRTSFGRFIAPDLSVNIAEIPERYINYAGYDAVITLMIFEELEKRNLVISGINKINPALRLSAHIQTKAMIGLKDIEARGIHIDKAQLRAIAGSTDEIIGNTGKKLVNYGYWDGKGANSRYRAVVEKIESEHEIRLPRKSSMPSMQEKDLLKFADDCEFFQVFMNHKENTKLKNTFIEKYKDRNIVKPSFNVLVNTGRTSCRGFNLQQLPRIGGIRECFIPSEGYYFISADYSAIEICALAQICLERYGKSKLAEIINNRVDPHKWLAAQINHCRIDEVSKADRQKAKTASFGFPGGLGLDSFINFAEVSYNIKYTREEAAMLKEQWLESFPEMKEYISISNEKLICKYNLGNNPFNNPDIAVAVFRKILSGNACKSDGTQYNKEIIDWAWNVLMYSEFRNKELFIQDIRERKTSFELCAAVFNIETVVTKTGLVRPFCSYSQALNNPFQATVAAGAKLALYRLFREGFRIVNFLHDEFIVEVPVEADHLQEALKIEKIMIEEMQRVIPDVRISVEYALMDRWYKGAEPVFDNKDNPKRLLLWKPKTLIAG